MILPKNTKIHHHPHPFPLERGNTLPTLQIAYHTFGQLNANKDNVVWVFHALTANSDPTDWWAGVVGEGTFINPAEHFIVCANVLGSFYGTTCPRSLNSVAKEAYGIDFPLFTVRDVVRIQHLLREHLGIEKIKLCIGGSFGGHQALEFALVQPDSPRESGDRLVQSMVLLATSARETAWSIAIHEAQRMAIESDVTWKNNDEKAGATGLKTARALGLLSYRTIDAYIQGQSDDTEILDNFKAASYMRYQGEKLEKRFHAHCYWHLTKCLDTHHVGRDRGGILAALRQITAFTTIIGIQSDMLIPPNEQAFLAEHIPNCKYYEIPSKYGHDGFLIEVEQINAILKEHFLKI